MEGKIMVGKVKKIEKIKVEEEVEEKREGNWGRD